MTQQSTSSKKVQDISNCVSAPFDPLDGQPSGHWQLCYNAHQNVLALSVSMTPSLALVDGTKLTSTIDADGLKDMIQFLCQVNLTMQKQNQKNKSGGS